MKRKTAAVLIVIGTSFLAVAQPSAWQIDPAHSEAQFGVRHMGISTVRGTFTKVSGAAHYDPADTRNDSVEVAIEAASVDTRVSMRDNDLRSDHFFDAQKFPSISFKSTTIESAGPNKLKVMGDLTIRGITKRVELAVEGPSKPVNDGNGHLHMGVSAAATIDRRDFGISGYQGMVGDEVKLTIDAELVQNVAVGTR